MKMNGSQRIWWHICKTAQANTQAKFYKRATKPTLVRNRYEMTTKQTIEKEGRRHNITYTQAGVSCFVGQKSGKLKVQFFVGSSVVKIPACV
jgi:hypothetical protein